MQYSQNFLENNEKHSTKIKKFNGTINDLAKSITELDEKSLKNLCFDLAENILKQSKNDNKNKKYNLSNELSFHYGIIQRAYCTL